MRLIVGAWLALSTAVSIAAPPSEYLAVDITLWSTSQLAGLPYFERYNPLQPGGAGAGFAALANNGVGVIAGNIGSSDVSGAYISSGSQSNIAAFGTYYWSYWLYDGTDNHYYWGNKTESPVSDVNVFGVIVGHSTMPGSSNGVNSTFGYDTHGYMFDSVTGEKRDLTPDAHRASMSSINDFGEITGYWSDSSTGHPFRRSPDGVYSDLVTTQTYSHSISPKLINNHGHVAGFVTVWTVPRKYFVFFSDAGTATEELPWPDQGGVDTGSIADMNEHDVIVGEAHQADSPVETLAVRWTREGGIWTAEALGELLSDGSPDAILDRSVAVNDAGYIIVSGHPDGTDVQNTRKYLLIPDTFPEPTCATLPPASVTSTGAVLSVKINAAGSDTGWELMLGTNYPTSAAVVSGGVTGFCPVLASMSITGLTPHTVYHYRVSATNASGQTWGGDMVFTTAWNWVSWSAENGSALPEDDANTNGVPDLLDYATAGGAYGLADASNALRFVLHRAVNADDVTLAVQVSSNLVDWQEGPSYGFRDSASETAYGVEVLREAAGYERERIDVKAPANLSNVYFRLKASLH